MSNLSSWVSLITLGPLFLYPFSFCPFRLPYLYCSICPAGCIWSRVRGIALLAILALNLKRGLFCNYLCPLGALQKVLFKTTRRRLSVPVFFQKLRYLAIILIVFMLIVSGLPEPIIQRFEVLSASRILMVKLKNLFLGIFLLSVLASILNYRFLCHHLCPVSGLSKMLSRGKPIG